MTTVSGVPHWDDDPTSWDTIVLGGVVFPGWAKVSIDRGQKVDAKTSKGKNLAKVTLNGFDPARVTITWKVSEEDELAAVPAALAVIEPVPGKTDPTPVDIVHPAASIRSVFAIVIGHIKGPELDAGILTFTVEGIEFQAPKKTTGNGVGGGSGAFVFGVFGNSSGIFGAHAKPIGSTSSTGAGFAQSGVQGQKFQQAPGGPSPSSTSSADSDLPLWLRDDGNTFRANFIKNDPAAKAAFEANLPAGFTGGGTTPSDDVTTTPDGASGSAAGAAAGSAVPSPADTDAGP